MERFNAEKRSKFIIKRYKDVNMDNKILNTEYLRIIMMDKYNGTGKNPPCNYIIGNDVLEVINPYIVHTEIGEYNNDIVIYICTNNINKLDDKTFENLYTQIAITSEEFGMKIHGNIISDEMNSNTLLALESKAVLKRNELNYRFMMCEHYDGDKFIINNRIDLIKNINCFKSYQQIANAFNLPVEIIKDLNPHLTDYEISMNDIIYIPNVITHTAKKDAIEVLKKAYRIIKTIEESGE